MMRRALRLAVLCTGLVAASPGIAAEVIVAPDGSLATLQSLVDGASSNTVLVVPPGEWVYDGTLTIAQDDLVLLGSGAGQTRLYRVDEQTAPLILVDGASGVRVAGITIDGNASDSSASSGVGLRFNDAQDFRADHCAFNEHGASGVRTNGTSTGVVDHCRFDRIYKPPIANLGYGVVVYGDGTIGDVPLGSPLATFVEDAYFRDTRHAVASNNGARYVFRYNTVEANVVGHAIDAHGHEYGSTVGTEWVDVSHNVVRDPVYTGYAARIRGGKGVLWSNEFLGYDYGVAATEGTDQATGPLYVWGNTVTGQQVSIGAGAEVELTAAPGYTPYTYPHPLVSDLDVQAGPDMIAFDDPGGATVYLDASATSASSGSITAWRWYSGATLLSSCARDVVDLPAGTTLLVLEVERDDGLMEYDTAVVEARSGVLASSTSRDSRWFVPAIGKATVSFDVTPLADGMDGYVALTGRHEVQAHDDNAIILRTNNQGVFDAYDGTDYMADQAIPYAGGSKRHVEVRIDVAAQRYSVVVDGLTLATDYAFRRTESGIGQVNTWHSVGGLEVEALTVTGDLAQPDPACGGGGAAGQAGAGGDGGAGGVGGAGGSTVDAGSGGTGGNVDGGSSPEGGSSGGSTQAAPPSNDASGCACSTPTGGHGWMTAALGLGILFGITMRRTARSPRNEAGSRFGK